MKIVSTKTFKIFSQTLLQGEVGMVRWGCQEIFLFCQLGPRSAPKISVLRGSGGLVRVSILEFRISDRFVLYIALSTQQCWKLENNFSFEASDSK